MKSKNNKLPAIHPGEILREEFLTPQKISQTKLAISTNIPLKIVKEICQAKKAINAEIALRLGTYFGTSAELWLGLQNDYEQEYLEDIKANQGTKIKKEIEPLTVHFHNHHLNTKANSRSKNTLK